MKYFRTILLSSFLITSISKATDVCIEFKLEADSTRISRFTLIVPERKNQSGQFPVRIAAERTTARSTLTSFNCTKKKTRSTCTQPDGGGDFTLEDVKGIPTLTLTYINLLVGSTGSVRLDSEGAINEEFAVYDSSNSEESDSEEDSGELSEFSISGSSVPCTRKL